MATSYNTPGVYVEEVSTLPASVAAVATAIPAFIGYTEQGGTDPVRVKSLPEFEEIFGKGPSETYDITLDTAGKPSSFTVSHSFHLYRAVSLFYANGGGVCYIASAGNYGVLLAPDQTALTDALAKIQKIDEPTLLAVPDAVGLSTSGGTAAVHQALLAQAGKTKDRFGILDIFEDGSPVLDTDMAALRNGVLQNLDYGAAYYPQLKTRVAMDLNPDKIQVGGAAFSSLLGASDLAVSYDELVADQATLANMVATKDYLNSFFNFSGTTQTGADKEIKHKLDALVVLAEDIAKLNHTSGIYLTNANALAYTGPIAAASGELKGILDELYQVQEDYAVLNTGALTANSIASNSILDPSDYNTTGELFVGSEIWAFTDNAGTVFSPIPTTFVELVDAARAKLHPYITRLLAILSRIQGAVNSMLSNTLGQVKSSDSLYKELVAFLNKKGVAVPPSGAVAGVYAQIDAGRGVWKAPANISLNGVFDVTFRMDDDDQGRLNVDPDAGKSINGIRPFSGKGIRVWGARTLAGNDNEWRYINVRRLFINIEESVKKAMDQYVFEGNNAETWVKVKAMIENFLTNFWRAGALTGAKADDAFFVSVGLGKTMTEADVLNGYMIVDIGIAAVRPAEFIILRFQHKVQEA